MSSAAAANSGANGKPAAAGAAAIAPADDPDTYNQHWVSMPRIEAPRLPGGGSTLIEPRPGRILVLLFVASWCEPCQQLMPTFRRLERKYQRTQNADFVYIFSHDTRDDAVGFMKEFNIPTAYLANAEVLTAYHNPEMPAIYVGDRHGWMTTRYLKAGVNELEPLSTLLDKLTAY